MAVDLLLVRGGRGWTSLAAAALLVASCTAAPSAPSAHHGEPRIVSINPCIDAVLARVANPRQIAAVSRYSQDPRATSVPLAWARRFRATGGTAEEVVALRPDVVLAGMGAGRSTAQALRRLGVRLVEYPVPETVEESLAQVRDIARIAGHPDRGERLAGAIATAAAPARTAQVPALIWRDGGLVLGTGTLADALLDRAGFRNMSAAYGLAKWGVLPLEQLIAHPPRVLLSGTAGESGNGRSAQHPALRRLGTHIRVVPFAARLMNCGGPSIIDAMVRLRAIRAQVAA